jgi:hypothetical protein
MIVLEKSRFLHVPKCGGCWTMDALLAACPNAFGVYGEYAGGAHVQAHFSFPSSPHSRQVTFCSIRRPDDWLRSLWLNRVRDNWQYNWPANRFRSDTFFEFVQSILDSPTPAFISETYYIYCGDLTVEVLPMEHLQPSLIYLLRKLGEDFDEEAIKRTPEKNVAKSNSELIWNEEQRQKILATNQWAFARWRNAYQKYVDITAKAESCELQRGFR